MEEKKNFYEKNVADKAEAIANLFTISIQTENDYMLQLGLDEIAKLGAKENNQNVCAVAINRMILENVEVLLDSDDNVDDNFYEEIFMDMLVASQNLTTFGLKFEEQYKINKSYFEAIDELYEQSSAGEDEIQISEEVPEGLRDEIMAEVIETNKALNAINTLMDTLDLVADDVKVFKEKLLWFSISVNYLLRVHSAFSNIDLDM